MRPVLHLTAITHRYPGAARTTLSDVELEVQDGEMVAVLGPSGSGKTSLLRVMAGLERPESGDVLLDGVSVREVPPERRDLTVMFQKPHLFPHLDVRDNVAFADRIRGVGRTESRVAAQRYLDLVHLGDLARRRPRQLSGGQEQRVALARALAANRRVMLLDEPFSSLDASLRRSMHDLLGEVRAALAPTVVMVTHDLEEAGLAERVAVLVDGRIEQFDAVSTLYTRPRTVAVARLVGGFNELPGRIEDGKHHSVLGGMVVSRGGPSNGTGVALVRKEQLRLVDVGTPSSVTGRVVGVRRAGPRLDVVVEVDGMPDGHRSRVEVEAELGGVVRPGDTVAVRPRCAAAVWVVPGTDERPSAVPAPPGGAEQGTACPVPTTVPARRHAD